MKEDNQSTCSGKLIAGIVLAVLLTVGGFALYTYNNQPVEPSGPAGCLDGGLSQQGCVRACVAIVDLNNEALMNAKRIDSKEKDMLRKRAFENCLQACEAVQKGE